MSFLSVCLVGKPVPPAVPKPAGKPQAPVPPFGRKPAPPPAVRKPDPPKKELKKEDDAPPKSEWSWLAIRMSANAQYSQSLCSVA